jgi:sugar-specific transcriptional regulator TrmB
MYLHNELKQIGLNKSEITVYLYLLEEGLSSPPHIAKGTGIARTNCYNILLILKEKGLVEEHQAGKRKAYISSDPEALLRTLEKKKEAVERLLPDLRGLYTLQKNKPKIRFYEGWEQVKEIYLQTLNAKEIFAIGSTKHLHLVDEKFLQKFFTEIKTREIILNDILNSDSGEEIAKQTKELLKGYYDVRVLPRNIENFKTDILIWEDNIALITLEEPIFGTVLTNKLLAETFRIIFNIMKQGIH